MNDNEIKFLAGVSNKYYDRRSGLVGFPDRPATQEYLEVNLMEPLLLCPICLEQFPDGRGSWLHQTAVEAFFRDEDHEKGVHGYIADTNSLFEQDGNCGDNSRNPSSRRDGLIVSVECVWHPQYVLELHIAQHKGQTVMNWLAKKYLWDGELPF